MRIKDISVKEIKDSRGESTIEVDVAGENGNVCFSQIPSGKSRGKNEVAILRPTEAKRALEEKIKPNVIGQEFNSIRELDDFLISLDGTDRKEKLGGNLVLGISIAFARLTAKIQKKELWQVLNDEFFGGEVHQNKPLIFSNLINGGVHAKNNLDIQECMVVVKTHSSYKESVKSLKDFYVKLGDVLKNKFRLGKLSLGDEGGYSLEFANNLEPVLVLAEAIKENDFRKIFSIALDAAANGFYEDGVYNFDGRKLDTGKMIETYRRYFETIPLLVSIEDPFAEDDPEGFKKLQLILDGKLVVGDDLTVTNPITIKKVAEDKLISGVIIKPNQIGTVTETCEAMRVAHANGIKTIVSHRSGEVEDPFIIHFARAGGAYGVKIGAPVESRMSKFRELEKIYG